MQDHEDYIPSRPGTPRTPGTTVAHTRCVHQSVKQQLHDLASSVHDMASPNNKVLQSLLTELQGLKGTTYAGRVFDALAHKAPVCLANVFQEFGLDYSCVTELGC
jgi:hypothetical protein